MYSTQLEIVNKVMNKFDTFGFVEHNYPNAIGMWKEEQASLVYTATLSDPNYNWIEIGSFMGGSAVLLCIARRLLGNKPKVVSVDIDFSGFQGAFKRNVYRIGKFNDIHESIECSSFDLPSYYNEPLSLAFIDGWHSFKGVMTDFNHVNKLLVPGGIVLFHDTFPQPYKDNDIDNFYKKCMENYETLMSENLPSGKFSSSSKYHEAEKQQNFMIDEAIAHILHNLNFELVELPTINGQTHFDRVKEYKHGTTSPYPGIVAIRKIGD